MILFHIVTFIISVNEKFPMKPSHSAYMHLNILHIHIFLPNEGFPGKENLVVAVIKLRNCFSYIVMKSLQTIYTHDCNFIYKVAIESNHALGSCPSQLRNAI